MKRRFTASRGAVVITLACLAWVTNAGAQEQPPSQTAPPSGLPRQLAPGRCLRRGSATVHGTWPTMEQRDIKGDRRHGLTKT